MLPYLKTVAAPTKSATLAHYKKVEAEAKSVMELAADLKASCDALRKSIEDARPDFNKILRDFARPPVDLDAMSKPERVNELLDVLKDIGLTRVP